MVQDDNGQITQKIETVGGISSTYDYTYDSIGRLLSVTKNSSLVEEYEYDLNGTRNYEMNTLRGITGRSFTLFMTKIIFLLPDQPHTIMMWMVFWSAKQMAPITTYNYSITWRTFKCQLT